MAPAGRHRDPGDPRGPCRDQADTFLVTQEPTGLACSILGCWALCF